jgi:hypothetical protein
MKRKQLSRRCGIRVGLRLVVIRDGLFVGKRPKKSELPANSKARQTDVAR